jgi:hypothetical protein
MDQFVTLFLIRFVCHEGMVPCTASLLVDRVCQPLKDKSMPKLQREEMALQCVALQGVYKPRVVRMGPPHACRFAGIQRSGVITPVALCNTDQTIWTSLWEFH